MSAELDRYFIDVVLPCKGFNLWNYMSCLSPMDWDFDKIHEELDRLKGMVEAAKQAHR